MYATEDIPINTNLGIFQVEYTKGKVIYTSLSMIRVSEESYNANCVRRTNNLKEYYLSSIIDIKKGEELTLKM
jgi:hypothetical protein